MPQFILAPLGMFCMESLDTHPTYLQYTFYLILVFSFLLFKVCVEEDLSITGLIHQFRVFVTMTKEDG